MKLTIRQKLLLLSIVPTITLLIFSVWHFKDNFSQNNYNNELIYNAELLNLTDEFIHAYKSEKDIYKATVYLHEIRKKLDPKLHKENTHLQILDPNFELNSASENQISKEVHELQHIFSKTILRKTTQKKEGYASSLLIQISLSLLTIFLLQILLYIIYKKMFESIQKLDLGILSFFSYLNHGDKAPKDIVTGSDDEIQQIADNINEQIQITQALLEEDQDFIDETTQIVTMMKEGDFSEHLYFEPNNPKLKELGVVFNELIELINAKIEEQTKSLEQLNSSLEDQVYHQTLELQEKITELTIARDKAIQAEIAKDEFLANMSHEIRTPLNAILGFVSILKKRIDDEKSTDYLNIIDNSGKSLLTIINDILDFSKIQSGKFSINPYSLDPVEEFSTAMLLFASKAYEKHLIYAVYIDPNLPKELYLDGVRVQQIISNLLSNAIKFTKEDGTVKVSVTMKKNSTLQISIQDSGIGISQENQSKIFSAFEQADGSTTRKYGGTGLGLSISYKLATLMGGTLTVQSKEGIGSTFTFMLPVEVRNKEARNSPLTEHERSLRYAILNTIHHGVDYTKLIKKYLRNFGVTDVLELEEYQSDGYDILFFVPDDDYNEEIVHSDTTSIAILRTSSIKLANLKHIEPLYAPFIPKSIVQAIHDSDVASMPELQESFESDPEQKKYQGHILIAEDNKTNQMLISLLLDDYGLTYKITNNGQEAYEAFKDGKFDLVLMDENMPELNGIGSMKLMKEYEKDNALISTPIVALTASVLESDKEMFLQAGMDGFVGKPIDNKELETELNKFLKH